MHPPAFLALGPAFAPPRMGRVLPWLAPLLLVPLLHSPARSQVVRTSVNGANAYLRLEVLDDDLIHVETAAGVAPPDTQAIFSSPMVFKRDYAGPTQLRRVANGLETRELSLSWNPSTLCLTATERSTNRRLLTVCPQNLDQPRKQLRIDSAAQQAAYGLGQEFMDPASRPAGLGAADGDWLRLGQRNGLNDLGNGFQGFRGGAVGNIQMPVLYALGPANLNYGLVLDNVYFQSWDFRPSPWNVSMYGDQLRYFILGGPNLLDLRRDLMELTGRPPVPPRKAFGLWVSEFGYDNWNQIDTILTSLRQDRFPVDGFVLDLNWFGGIRSNDPPASAMGRLNWDENQEPLVADGRYSFPNPANKIKQYWNDNIGIAAIEESYIANSTGTYNQMPKDLMAFRRDSSGRCNAAQQTVPVEIDASDFWGIGRMIDWSDAGARRWIHANRRLPNLSAKGVMVHWTDLGEPERFDRAACYEGVERTASGLKNEHSDVHNLYNLLWNQSIWDGYVQNRGTVNGLGLTNPRPLLLTRSGALGIQRYGAALWSGDIPSNLSALATHFNTQLHMAFSGVDYYGSDIGGFRREAMPGNDKSGSYRGYEDELYTQWLANGAWFDVPVRPHTDNEFNTSAPSYPTAPNQVGKKASNLANLRQRYELIPYYYSLAHRAHQFGEPLIAPMALYYQNDPAVLRMGHQKLIGPDLLVGVVASHGEIARDIYLPAGDWVNYHSNEWVRSRGQTLSGVPVYRDGLFRLPAFARAGAILPLMPVDADTKDAEGHRLAAGATSGPTPLLLRVFADGTPSRFTLYEDDGRTVQYASDGSPFYPHRTIPLSQQRTGNQATVTIGAATSANGGVAGAPMRRSTVVELVVDQATAQGVSFNGSPLPAQTSRAAFEAAPSGWFKDRSQRILAKSPILPVTQSGIFRFTLTAASPRSSMHFVCDRGFTNPGESIYVSGNLPELGNNDPQKAVKLDPNMFYQYIIDGRTEFSSAKAPIWTGVVSNLPVNQSFQWQCLKRQEGGTLNVLQRSPAVPAQTSASGYGGQTRGTF
ncbi:MAG: TIM-barrel domain-containing protein [Cyanobacteriota bacterium]